MRISEVNLEDGRMCIQLIKLLTAGRWDLSGADAEALVLTKKWVQALANDMGQQLKGQAPAASPKVQDTGFRIKAVGQLPGKTQKPKKKK